MGEKVERAAGRNRPLDRAPYRLKEAGAAGLIYALYQTTIWFHQGFEAGSTHLSVIDKDGVAVSLTQTLLSLWGSRVTVPGTGLIMNNGMMWFDPEPGRPNSVAGGKKPLANMSPAIITKNGEAIAAIGASGGRRIQNCQAMQQRHSSPEYW